MKKIMLLLTFLVLTSVVFAIDKPPSVNPLKYTSKPQMLIGGLTINPPTAPSTSTSATEICQAWTTRNEKCNGDLRVFEQCVRTASGNSWDLKSDNCNAYGEYVKCEGGVCIKPLPSLFQWTKIKLYYSKTMSWFYNIWRGK